MQARIALITVLADDMPAMLSFYRDVLQFPVKNEQVDYAEFEHPGVRFAVCARSELTRATGHHSFAERRRGQAFELAFPVASPDEVDTTYASLTARGATPITPPADMPWGQRAAFIADPDGNIHEIFAELHQPPEP